MRKFGIAKPMNIALAEAATIAVSGQRFHEVTMYCEPWGGIEHSDFHGLIRRQLQSAGFNDVDVERYEPCAQLKWKRARLVDYGWVQVPGWQRLFSDFFSKAEILQIDLSKAVVSADTKQRLIRFVFPKKGTCSVEIEHSDEPGALEAITRALTNARMNILSALLRRGGVIAGQAMLIAVCEPESICDGDEVKVRIREALDSVETKFNLIAEINEEGRLGKETIYNRSPGEFVVRPPTEQFEKVEFERRSLPNGRFPVFFSHRFFTNNPRARTVEETVRTVLEGHNCHTIEAYPDASKARTVFDEVSAKLWVSRAGVVLVMGEPGERSATRAFSVNLAHEFGFLQGQGRPISLLVERNLRDALGGWSIGKGLMRYDFDASYPGRIAEELKKWIASLPR